MNGMYGIDPYVPNSQGDYLVFYSQGDYPVLNSQGDYPGLRYGTPSG
jgi:hypothetical protein